jgi:hypothetical protein
VCSNCKVYFSGKAEKCEYNYARSAKFRQLLEKEVPIVSRSLQPRRLKGFPVEKNCPRLLPKYVGVSAIDPFAPIKSSLPRADDLLHHCMFPLNSTRSSNFRSSSSNDAYYGEGLSYINGRCLPTGCTPERNEFAQSIWPLVQSDKMFHHVMLQISAFELEWLRGYPNKYDLDKYHQEGIRMLRDRVQDPVTSISDETIAAVASLASLEVSFFDDTNIENGLSICSFQGRTWFGWRCI